MKKKLISNCSNTQGGVFEVSPSFLRGWPYHEFETQYPLSINIYLDKCTIYVLKELCVSEPIKITN